MTTNIITVSSGPVYTPTTTRAACGHRFTGASWNTEREARKHGEQLLKRSCGACIANKRFAR